MTLDDLGVTNPQSGYSNAELMGKVSTTMTGGIFSSDVTKYLTDEYIQYYGTVVNKKEIDPTPVNPSPVEKEITVTYPTIPTGTEVKELTLGLDNAEEAKNIFKNSLLPLNIAEDVHVLVSIDVKSLKEDEIDENEIKNMID